MSQARSINHKIMQSGILALSLTLRNSQALALSLDGRGQSS